MSNLACPRCGGVTSVTETRPCPVGLRRRRRCASDACDQRFTTVEVVLEQLEQLEQALARFLGRIA